MRKHVRQLLAVVLAVMMIIPVSLLQSSAAYSASRTSSHTVVSGVTYAKYSVSSGQNSHTANTYTVTVNPKTSDYIVMPFAGYAGTSGNLLTQYNQATGSRYHYQVAAVINGNYFSMGNPYGLLTGLNVSGGKLESVHMPFDDECVAFMSDGSVTPVYSSISNVVEINGTSYDNLIWYVNKRRSTSDSSDWSIYDKVFYYDKSCGSKCDSCFNGTEVLCNKLDNTDIAIGHTLVGEVVSVSRNTYGGNIGENQFVLYYPNTSSAYTSLMNGLKAGDSIKISIKENNSEAKYITENCIGMLNNIGWLVKNGVNRTTIDSNIGGHSVTLSTCWTAYGWKADGTVILIASDGYTTNGITMRDIAQQMINLGCTNVVRLDGGGSTALYLSNTGSGNAGYAYNQGRAVGDCLLVLKRVSAQTTSLKNALNQKLTAASEFSAFIPDVISKASSVYNNSKSMDGDYKHAIMLLKEQATPSGILNGCLNLAASSDADNYSDYAADLIQSLYLEGKRILASGASDSQYTALASRINSLLNSHPAGTRISLGAKYATGTVNNAYPDTGTRELTDGCLFGTDPIDAAWTGFQSSKKVGSDSYGDYTEVFLDLGSVKTPNKASVSACQYTSWAICAPSRVMLYASENGKDFYPVAPLTAQVTAVSGGNPQEILYTLENITNISSRYYLVRMYYSGTHMFIGEVSLYSDAPADGTYYVTTGVDSFNANVTTDAVRIFTTGTLTHSNANLTWSTSYVCEKTNDGYKVTQIIAPQGNQSYSYTVPTGGFIIAFHGASYYDQVAKRYPAVGDICTLTGVDVARLKVYPLARVAFYPNSTATVTKPVANLGAIKSAAAADYEITGNSIRIGQATSVNDIKAIFTDPRVQATNITGSYSGTGTVYTDASGNTYTTYVYGDLNGDGIIKPVDYLMLKRIALGTYDASSIQSLAGHIDGKTYSVSYALVKRHCLGTYTIED